MSPYAYFQMPLPKDPQALEPAGEHFGPSLSPHNEWINQGRGGFRQGTWRARAPLAPPAARDGVGAQSWSAQLPKST